MLNEWQYRLLTEDAVEKIKSEIKKLSKDPLFAAYSDIWSYDLFDVVISSVAQELKRFLPKSNLDYRDKRWMSANQYEKIMRKAVRRYNDYDAIRAGAFFKAFSTLKYQPGREGSVVTYVKGFKDKDEIIMFVGMAEDKRVEEISIEKNKSIKQRYGWGLREVEKGLENIPDNKIGDVEIRLWWD